MIYTIPIINIETDDYEGFIDILYMGKIISCYYQAPYNFIQNYMVGQSYKLDIWLIATEIYDSNNTSDPNNKRFKPEIKNTKYQKMSVNTALLDDGSQKHDCYLSWAEIKSSLNIVNVYGWWQIFFPETEYAFNEIM